MSREGFEIMITAPDGRFTDKSLGVHADLESAQEDAKHYKEMGMKVRVRDLSKGRFIKLK